MKEKIIAYIKNDVTNESLDDIELKDDLLGTGLIDSMGMMKLLAFIEKEANFKIPPEDMTIENFMTLESIMGYIARQNNAGLNEA